MDDTTIGDETSTEKARASARSRLPDVAVVLVVVALIAFASAGAYSHLTRYERAASENCAELLRLRELNNPDPNIAPYLLGDDDPKVTESTQEMCPNSVEWASGLVAEQEAEDGQSRPSSPEPRTAEDVYTDPDASLLEKQCAAAADIYATGNGPGSPYSDYTDADLADQLEFYAQNC